MSWYTSYINALYRRLLTFFCLQTSVHIAYRFYFCVILIFVDLQTSVTCAAHRVKSPVLRYSLMRSFSKVSALVNLLLWITIDTTFENLYLMRSCAACGWTELFFSKKESARESVAIVGCGFSSQHPSIFTLESYCVLEYLLFRKNTWYHRAAQGHVCYTLSRHSRYIPPRSAACYKNKNSQTSVA